MIHKLAPGFAAVLLAGSVASRAEIVTVDNNMTNGYMNVFALDGLGGPDFGAFQFGSNWGLADVKSTNNGSNIILEANYNTYVNNPGSSYWRDNGGAGPGGNKWMVASTFTGVSASWFTDGNCNFKVEVTDYTFNEGYTVRAFIKGFSADFSSNFQLFSDPLTNGSIVDLNFATAGWAEIQYGFEVQGINANPDFSPGSATVSANVTPPAVIGIPNPGFEAPNGSKWAFDQANDHFVAYPTEGGNPGGYAEIDATSATNTFFGVLVANGRLKLPLSALSLTAGQTYVFAMDMKVVDGPNIGGFKVDFFPSGSTNDMYPTPTSSPEEWSTYSFPVTIPLGTTDVKLVPLWGLASKVGFDNLRLAGPFAASITPSGSDVKISWPSVTGRSYQVRKCDDLASWANFGSPVNGNGSTLFVTDPVLTTPPGRAFFQVIETSP